MKFKGMTRKVRSNFYKNIVQRTAITLPVLQDNVQVGDVGIVPGSKDIPYNAPSHRLCAL